MTTFADLYHPALGNVHISVPNDPTVLSLYESHGWVLSTGGGPDPTPIDLTVGLGDLRYAKLGDIPTPGTPTGDALRAAFGRLVPTATKTAAYTAAAGELAMMNVSGGATVLTLPTAPADKSQVGYRAIGATASVPLTINRGGSTDTIGTTGATSTTVALTDEITVLQYDAANTRWLAVSNIKTKASLDAAYAPSPLPSAAATAGLTRLGFDPTRQLYNLSNSSFRRWRAALSAAANGTAVARLNCYGDSITFGYLGTPKQWSGSYPVRLRQRIAARTGNTGTGVVYPIDYSGDDLRWTFTGTWTQLAGYGPFGAACYQTNAPGSTVAFAPDVPCDSFTVHYLTSSGGGTWNASIDGGASTPVNANTGSLGYATATFAAGSSGVHTLTLTAPASGFLYLIGVEATNGTSGIRVTRCAKGGAKASDLIASTNGAGASVVTAIDKNLPDLGILFFGHNEYLQQVAVATYKTNMQTAIDRIRTTNNGDVLLVAPVPNSDQTKTIGQDAYRQALYQLADTNDVPLLDVAHRWGSYVISNAAPLSLYGDVTHPNSRGYGDIAGAVFDAVMLGQ